MKLRYAELEGQDKSLLLIFLNELERRKMLWSKLELSEDGKMTERVWYGYDTSKELEGKDENRGRNP
jgi:hypothetical protein